MLVLENLGAHVDYDIVLHHRFKRSREEGKKKLQIRQKKKNRLISKTTFNTIMLKRTLSKFSRYFFSPFQMGLRIILLFYRTRYVCSYYEYKNRAATRSLSYRCGLSSDYDNVIFIINCYYRMHATNKIYDIDVIET